MGRIKTPTCEISDNTVHIPDPTMNVLEHSDSGVILDPYRDISDPSRVVQDLAVTVPDPFIDVAAPLERPDWGYPRPISKHYRPRS